MKKKIAVQDLEIGMYISALDRPWLETPFLFQGFEIRSLEEILQLRRFCQFVYIEVSDGYGAVQPRPDISIGDQQRKLEFELLRKAAAPNPDGSRYLDQTTVEEETHNVRAAHHEARALIRAVMDDIRLGRSLKVAAVKKVVTEMAASVIRNPDALVCFTQLRKKDEYTALHSLRVCILALVFGRHLGFDLEALNVLGMGALLHDIGKMKVPNEILNKPDPLTDAEYQIMKSHVPEGVAILQSTVGIPAAAIEVARCHHERHDGSGYVSGMRQEDIGLFGQIGGIVDYYDAITSDRAYHAALSPHVALKQMYGGRGREFHPTRVEQFIQCMGIYPIGSIVELNTGEVGVVVGMNRQRRLKPRVTVVLRSNSVPYAVPRTIDLMTEAASDGRPMEIERVVDPGVYAINPVDFLPTAANL